MMSNKKSPQLQTCILIESYKFNIERISIRALQFLYKVSVYLKEKWEKEGKRRETVWHLAPSTTMSGNQPRNCFEMVNRVFCLILKVWGHNFLYSIWGEFLNLPTGLGGQMDFNLLRKIYINKTKFPNLEAGFLGKMFRVEKENISYRRKCSKERFQFAFVVLRKKYYMEESCFWAVKTRVEDWRHFE